MTDAGPSAAGQVGAFGVALAAALAIGMAPLPATAGELSGDDSTSAGQVLLAQYPPPPPGYYPPPPGSYPPPGPPPPPPRYYSAPPRRYYSYAPPPPPAYYSPFYFDAGLTLGLPILWSRDIDGNGDSGLGIGAGLGLHLDAGLKVNRYWGLGLNFAWGGYALSYGNLWDLGHADLSLIVRGFRGGLGVAWLDGGAGPDLYLGHFWRIGGPWVIGVSGDLMWNPEAGDTIALLNVELGLELGNR